MALKVGYHHLEYPIQHSGITLLYRYAPCLTMNENRWKCMIDSCTGYNKAIPMCSIKNDWYIDTVQGMSSMQSNHERIILSITYQGGGTGSIPHAIIYCFLRMFLALVSALLILSSLDSAW